MDIRKMWEVKRGILKEIFENDFYDYYGVCDPMKDLADTMCSERKEKLKCAEIMMYAGNGYIGADVVKMYKELGEDLTEGG